MSASSHFHGSFVNNFSERSENKQYAKRQREREQLRKAQRQSNRWKFNGGDANNTRHMFADDETNKPRMRVGPLGFYEMAKNATRNYIHISTQQWPELQAADAVKKWCPSTKTSLISMRRPHPSNTTKTCHMSGHTFAMIERHQ